MTVLYDANTLYPFWLWSDIVAYYDTDINQANIILFDVKCLDMDPTHALLLVTIKDNQFEMVCVNIVHKLTVSIDEILKDIHKHDTSMQMKDGACLQCHW